MVGHQVEIGPARMDGFLARVKTPDCYKMTAESLPLPGLSPKVYTSVTRYQGEGWWTSQIEDILVCEYCGTSSVSGLPCDILCGSLWVPSDMLACDGFVIDLRKPFDAV